MSKKISLMEFLENELEESVLPEYEEMMKRFIKRLNSLEASEDRLKTITQGE